MLATLNEYLDRVSSMSLRADRLLVGPDPDSIALLAKARAEQSRVFTSYQLFVHRELFEPVIASGPEALSHWARELKLECILLAEEFRAFSRRWNIADVAADWQVYQPAALAFAKRIIAHADGVRAAAAAHLRANPLPTPTKVALDAE